MSSKGSLCGSESESSMLSSSNSYLAHTMENVVCETIPLCVSESSSSQKQYSCNICSTRSSQLKELRSHLFNHMGAIPYFCTLCNFSDISLTQLYLHLLCHKEFLNDSEKLTKLKDVFNRMVFSCNLCFFSFKSNKDLATHYMKHITNSYKCKSCRFVFFTETELLIHAHIHSLSLVCRVCDKTFPSSQKAFLSHVLSHDYTRLYRNFPKVSVNPHDLPFYKSFFEICSQVTNVELPMFCGILKTSHKNLKTKPPSLKEEKSSPVIRIFDDHRHSSLTNNRNQETIASSSKRTSSSVERDLWSDDFKLSNYSMKNKSSKDLPSPDPESNEIEIQMSADNSDALQGRHLETSTEIKESLSPLKSSPLIDEKIKMGFPIINHAYSIKEHVDDIDVFHASNDKRDFKNQSIYNQDEASVPKPKESSLANYSNTFNNHLITNIKEEFLDDTDEECPNNNDLGSGHSLSGTGFDKFSIFSKCKDFNESCDIKQNIGQDILDKRRVSVVLERLPAELVFAATGEDTIDKDVESPEDKPILCFKELTVVTPKLPSYVKDLASFKRYERKQKRLNPPTGSSLCSRYGRRYSNLDPLKESEDRIGIIKYVSNVIKLNPESISIHNTDNTSPFDGIVNSSVKDTRGYIKTERMDTSPSEMPALPLFQPPPMQVFIDQIKKEGSDLNSMKNLDSPDHLCEDGEDCCCKVSDCDTQSLDVEEDINSIKNRITLLKTALYSVQETSKKKFRFN